MSSPRSAGSSVRESVSRFEGFALPTSNTLYCPNQFFDVCLPNCSRGCVRIVAYMLRKTLGWCDAEGKPLKERFTITYGEIERHAGVSRDMIKAALTQAIEGCFIRCLQRPRANARGQAATSGLYELRWDESGAYVKDPRQFHGFFAGEGNRTYIPNQFFDVVIRGESLALIKVVGSIIRFSIGFQTKWGHRRQQVSLSYQDISRYAHIRSRTTLSKTINEAIDKRYVTRVKEGCFDPNGGRSSRSAVYALRWRNQAADEPSGRKSGPEEKEVSERSEKWIGSGRKSGPADRSEKWTGIQITRSNNTLKQNEDAVAASFEKLIQVGFDARAARSLAQRHSIEQILNQIDWLDRRGAQRNRLGMLRRAIEQDWSPPGQSTQQLGQPNFASSDPLSADKAELVRRFRSPFNPSSS